jgi:hypothetical protein
MKKYTCKISADSIFLISKSHWYMATHRIPKTVPVKTGSVPLCTVNTSLIKRNHQLLGASSLLCKLRSHHTTSGTQGIDGMLPSASQATAAKEEIRELNSTK